jgi:hypothetical protein
LLRALYERDDRLHVLATVRNAVLNREEVIGTDEPEASQAT